MLFSDLPFEILMIIAEYDNKSFIAIRSINRDVRDYTNLYMDRYKKIFSVDVCEENPIYSLFSHPTSGHLCCAFKYVDKYKRLPNGHKHGLYERYIRWSIIDNFEIHETPRLRFNYQDDNIVGKYEEYFENGKTVL
jgi:hypothetical protein